MNKDILSEVLSKALGKLKSALKASFPSYVSPASLLSETSRSSKDRNISGKFGVYQNAQKGPLPRNSNLDAREGLLTEKEKASGEAASLSLPLTDCGEFLGVVSVAYFDYPGHDAMAKAVRMIHESGRTYGTIMSSNPVQVLLET